MIPDDIPEVMTIVGKVEAAARVQLPAVVSKPALQLQPIATSEFCVPELSGQTTHVVSPLEAAICPEGHARHASAPDEPASAENLPTSQGNRK